MYVNSSLEKFNTLHQDEKKLFLTFALEQSETFLPIHSGFDCLARIFFIKMRLVDISSRMNQGCAFLSPTPPFLTLLSLTLLWILDRVISEIKINVPGICDVIAM